jgi:hypothetical protein
MVHVRSAEKGVYSTARCRDVDPGAARVMLKTLVQEALLAIHDEPDRCARMRYLIVREMGPRRRYSLYSSMRHDLKTVQPDCASG